MILIRVLDLKPCLLHSSCLLQVCELDSHFCDMLVWVFVTVLAAKLGEMIS